MSLINETSSSCKVSRTTGRRNFGDSISNLLNGSDLCTLRENYRAWNTYLPEEFLWHTFHGLVATALRLETGPFQDFVTGKTYENEGEKVVVHFDLKPENVFLGEPVDTQPSHFSNYPCIKLADFGLAAMTGPDDMYNPRKYRGLGTTSYQPPVRCLGCYGESS
jgi:serine/threonine protein kinase